MAKRVTKKKRRSVRKEAGAPPSLAEVLAWLERKGTKTQIGELARYGITATRPFGVAVGDLKRLAKEIGRDHGLALGLWESGRYEARMLATMVDDPARVTLSQMNAWVAGFDNWALVDTACFHLFDRTPHAWKKAAQWARARAEMTKRAAFALLWSLSVHDKEAEDRRFLEGLELIEAAAGDERNFVKKGVDMALRAIGKRNRALNRAAVALARRLEKTDDPTRSWIGRHALRELLSEKVRARLA